MIGHLSVEQFNQSGTLGKGSYSYNYDARGRTMGLTETLDSSSYGFSYGYNDANQQTTVLYYGGTTLHEQYSTTGWLSNVTLTGTLTANLALNLQYGLLGAGSNPTGASVGNGLYTFSASYDLDGRLTQAQEAATTGGTVQASTARSYDGVGNVTAVDTSYLGGTQTDNQSFCYDEQNRLVWATSQTASGPCSPVGGGNTAGTLTGQSAQYTASYAYDTLGRLTSSPLGPYTYGNSAHLHAVTSIGLSGGGSPTVARGGSSASSRPVPSSATTTRGLGTPSPAFGFTAPPYSASYDAAGNMVCRSTSTAVAQSCWNGNTGGAQLSYDNEGRLVAWQNAPSSPTTTVTDAYDGEGQRVAQRVTVSGSTTTTYDLAGGAGLAEQSQPSGTLTTYYSVPGVCSAISVGSTLSYLATDGLGSVSAALSSSSVGVTAQQLYGPYGSVRYASGSMPTAKGFTGQYADAATG